MSFHKTAAAAVASCLLVSQISVAAPQDAVEMSPVTIYGAGFDEPTLLALPQMELITSAQIQRSGLNTVGDILDKLGNLHMQQDLGVNMNASPDIRGYGATASNNTLILIDGVKLSQNEQSPARIWSIPVEAIDHIEIIRGSSTVLYGEGATSGVINIITNKQKADLAFVSMGLGTYATRNANAFLSKKLADGQLSFFGKTSKSNGYRQQSESDLKSSGIQYDHTLNAKVSFGLRYGQDTDRANLPGFLSMSKFALDPTQPQYALATLYNQQPVNTTVKTVLSSAYLKIADGDVTYLFDASQKTADTDCMDTRFPDTNPAWSSSTDYLYHAKQNAFNAKVKIENVGIVNNTLLTGYSTNQATRDLNAWGLPIAFGLFSTGSTSTKSNAVFVQDDWRINAKDRITIGFRQEHFEQNATATVMQFGPPNTYSRQSGNNNLHAHEVQYSRTLDEAITAYVKTGQSYRLPNVDDLNRSCNNTCVQSLILQPQLNKDVEVGAVYRTPSNRGHLKFYQSKIDNEILFNKYANTELGYNVNIPKTRHQGIEFLNAYRYSSALSIQSGLDLIDAKFMVDSMESATGLYGKKISGTPNHIIMLGVDYALNENHAVAWKTKLIGNQYPQGDSSNKFELGSYSVTDVSYRWTDKKWTLIANANNVFDKRYGASILAATTSANYPYGVYPNWGRNFLFTLRYSFL